MKARRAAEFLDMCAEMQDRLAAAKAKVAQARESGDEQAVKTAKAELRPIADEVSAFRSWARATGSPPEGRPGRDAVISAREV